MNYKQSEQIADLIAAMANFHTDFQQVSLKKDRKNDHLKNTYVTLDNIMNTIRPLLSKNGLVIVQALAGEYLVTSLYHVSGQFIQSETPFSPMSGNRGTNSLQELGGGITYVRRYSLSALLSLSVDADDDANSSKIKSEDLKPKKKVNTIEELQKLLGWLINNPDRQNDYLKFYELTKEQKQFIENHLAL